MNNDNYSVLSLGGKDADMAAMLRKNDPFYLVWTAVAAQRLLPRYVATVHNYRAV